MHARRTMYNGNANNGNDYSPCDSTARRRFYIAGTGERIPYWIDVGDWRPYNAMTSNSAPSPWQCWASSEYSSSYSPWKAFNKTFGDAYGWCAASSDQGTPWITLRMDVPVKDVYFHIYNRTRSSLVNGPISGVVYGSDDNVNFYQIGSFNGLPGGTSAAGTAVYCSNYNDAFQFIRIVFTNWVGKGAGTNQYLAVGEIYMRGDYAS